ncbi:MAG: beta-N-acetylhexosaminidase [Rhodanobacteraceae bacterium]
MLIAGLAGTELSVAERDWLQAEQVSGIILFTRNFTDVPQLQALIGELRALRGDRFLICIDQEGGPVQRLREHQITRLPALARIGQLHDREPQAAVAMAEQHGWQMASEMRALGIDLSFAPVVDLGRGNRAIGERALHADPEVVADLATAYVRGMHLGGMAATMKHFPGHGSVLEDTHVDVASDPRTLSELRDTDMLPFAACIEAGAEAVMMAHVIYPQVDSVPAGYSKRWIKDILRGEMGFSGIVFSDDVAMAAAASAGALEQRLAQHLQAGCDLVLVCNPEWSARAVAVCRDMTPCAAEYLRPLRGSVSVPWQALLDDPQHAEGAARLSTLDHPSTEGTT